ncbi:MAG: hypothetical protein IT447_15575 [Phycisphaerales bacterium]|jgi:hypothetical protein|nr:hypothetical protein [Phycisphaerales bacterium]
MASETDFPARGKVTGINDGRIVFAPVETTYELHLEGAKGAAIKAESTIIQGLIRVTARKIWTVPSGGSFVVPIFGPPRIVQGRVRWASDNRIVLQAGVPIIVELPADPDAFDLVNGPIVLGAMVNVTCLPGATFEPVLSAVAR